MTGVLYCHTIAACHEVGDVLRMTRWTELAERWLTTVPAEVAFGAMCAVHRAQLQLLRGAWDQAESGALNVVVSLDANRLDYAAQAWYVIAEVRRLRGERGAAQAYGEAHARGLDPQPGRALLRLADGDNEGALASVLSAMTAAGTDPLRRATLCAALVEIAIAAGQLQDAAAPHPSWRRRHPRSPHRDWRRWRRPRAVRCWRLRATSRRHCQCCATPVGGGTNSVLTTSRRYLRPTRRGVPGVRRHRLRRRGTGTRAGGLCAAGGAPPGRELPDGLTRREYEVLTLVAAGRSNREIAAALVISDRTVARHLTNIYNKIGVASRTQAARYAIDHQMIVAR